MNDTNLQQLLDRMEITDLVNRVAVAVDSRDWEGVRSCFADEVEVDYTSLNGGAPATVRADDLVAGWRGGLSGFEATQHIVTNHVIAIEGDEATCRAYVHATHLLAARFGDPLWKVAGSYTYRLQRTPVGWKARAMTFSATWGEGNRKLPELAAQAGQR